MGQKPERKSTRISRWRERRRNKAQRAGELDHKVQAARDAQPVRGPGAGYPGRR